MDKIERWLDACVFPTRVGMNRSHVGLLSAIGGVPHTRGDEPVVMSAGNLGTMCSPHAWG